MRGGLRGVGDRGAVVRGRLELLRCGCDLRCAGLLSAARRCNDLGEQRRLRVEQQHRRRREHELVEQHEFVEQRGRRVEQQQRHDVRRGRGRGLTDRTLVREAQDRALVAAAGQVHLLGSLAWPSQTVGGFVAQWRGGQPSLPTPPAPTPVNNDALSVLSTTAAIDDGDPWGNFLADTARSYLGAADIIAHAGTAKATDASRGLYGCPSDTLAGSSVTHREAADRLLEVTEPLVAASRADESEYCISAETVAAEMRTAFGEFFGDQAPSVEVDPNLSAKAAASATRVRLRAATCFSENDIAQLIQHEGFVHSATALNGRGQGAMLSLSLSSPRTTATQEGLATLAEQRSGAMDLSRLRRLALRVVAIDMALAGADFIEVFEFFLGAGQTVEESAQSSSRVFRGGDVRGGQAFTKDVVYLQGLLSVHTFFRRAIVDGRPELIGRLFAGRLTLGDVLALEPLFEDGTITPARFVPPWAANLDALAAYLSFSSVLHRIDLDRVELSAFL